MFSREKTSLYLDVGGLFTCMVCNKFEISSEEIRKWFSRQAQHALFNQRTEALDSGRRGFFIVMCCRDVDAGGPTEAHTPQNFAKK